MLLIDGALASLEPAEKQQVADRLLDTFRDGLR